MKDFYSGFRNAHTHRILIKAIETYGALNNVFIIEVSVFYSGETVTKFGG
jgi:hypothetical protein